MSDWFPKPDDPEQELRVADDLINKADALLRRHRSTQEAPRAEVEVPLDDEDLPILTEVVERLEDDDLPVLTEAVSVAEAPAPVPPLAPAASPEAAPSNRATVLAEQLIELDTAIQREVEDWFINELPQLLSRELDRLSERLRDEAVAHLRATLLPALSEHVARNLEDLPRSKE